MQSIPRDSNHKDVAAMLVELTIEADEESFVIVLQHDVTCERSVVFYVCEFGLDIEIIITCSKADIIT